MDSNRKICQASVTSALVLMLAHSVVTHASALTTIKTPDVFVLVESLRVDLEELRVLMGMPKNTQPELAVMGAAPREVYFQALTLFEKSDRLCFAHTREQGTPPAPVSENIQPKDVYDVVDHAILCLRHVKDHYGLASKSAPGDRDDSKQPTDVFRAIVQANRQLNLMLDRRFASSDVFQQITQGIGYASRLLAHFPEATTIPEEPTLQFGKRPADVYRRLLGCVDRLRKIAGLSQIQMLELNVEEREIQQAEPSDVYDIASLIVAELAYLHSQLQNANPPRKVYYVGRKFPSHVYQRAGILEGQLVELERWVTGNPSWLQQAPAGQ